MAKMEANTSVQSPQENDATDSNKATPTLEKRREVRLFFRLAKRMAAQNFGTLSPQALEELNELLPDDVRQSPDEVCELLARLHSQGIEFAPDEEMASEKPVTEIPGCIVDSPEELQRREDERDSDFEAPVQEGIPADELDRDTDDIPFGKNGEALDAIRERELCRDVSRGWDGLLDALGESFTSLAALDGLIQECLSGNFPHSKTFFPWAVAENASGVLSNVSEKIHVLADVLTAHDQDSREAAEARGEVRSAIFELHPLEKFAAQVAKSLQDGGRENPDERQSAVAKIEKALRQVKVTRNELVQREQPFIYRTAQAFEHRGVSRDDLIQEGTLGLIDALNSLNCRRGSACRYLHEAIRQRMEQLIASQSAPWKLSLEESQALQAMEEAERASLTTTGEAPSDEKFRALAQACGVADYPTQSGADALRAAVATTSLSEQATLETASDELAVGGDDELLDEQWNGEHLFRELMETPLGSPLDVDWTKDPQVALDRREILEKLHEALGTLQENERHVLKMRFGLDGEKCRTLQEIGEEKGVTRERIRQIETKAMETLRHISRRRNLEAFFEGAHSQQVSIKAKTDPDAKEETSRELPLIQRLTDSSPSSAPVVPLNSPQKASEERIHSAHFPLTLEPIATFRSPFRTKFGIPRQSGLADDLRGEIHFEGSFRQPEALRGLESFRYLWLIWGFTHAKRTSKTADPLGENALQPSSSHFRATVRPPRLGGNVALGVFATRSPFRPNPLGLSSVRIASVDLSKMVIHTLGADLMDGTPIYDVKPYLEYADSHPGAGNGFVDSSPWQELAVTLTPQAEDDLLRRESPLSEFDLEGLCSVLRQDPRPHYRPDDPKRTYGFIFCGHDVRFVVSEGVLTVLEAPLV